MQRKIDDLKNHCIVCAYGRVGRTVAEELAVYKQPFVVVDCSNLHEELLPRAAEHPLHEVADQRPRHFFKRPPRAIAERPLRVGRPQKVLLDEQTDEVGDGDVGQAPAAPWARASHNMAAARCALAGCSVTRRCR